MCSGSAFEDIVCYDPENPYLVVIPTMLLAMGMLMFFTLGSSMVGDICDEDALNTGTRSEGSYYAVFWWFIKMGTAFASFVTGVLLTTTHFNESQSKEAAKLFGGYEVMVADAGIWATEGMEPTAETIKQRIELYLTNALGQQKDLSLRTTEHERYEQLVRQMDQTLSKAAKFTEVLENSHAEHVDDIAHLDMLKQTLRQIIAKTEALKLKASALVGQPELLEEEMDQLLHQATKLSQQSPRTLLMLRIIEIGLPIALSIFSILLTIRYPLTEERCYAIKAELEKRQQEHPCDAK